MTEATQYDKIDPMKWVVIYCNKEIFDLPLDKVCFYSKVLKTKIESLPPLPNDGTHMTYMIQFEDDDIDIIQLFVDFVTAHDYDYRTRPKLACLSPLHVHSTVWILAETLHAEHLSQLAERKYSDFLISQMLEGRTVPPMFVALKDTRGRFGRKVREVALDIHLKAMDRLAEVRKIVGM